MTKCPHPEKRSYETRKRARLTLKQWAWNRKGMCVYKCVCGWFHIGHRIAPADWILLQKNY